MDELRAYGSAEFVRCQAHATSPTAGRSPHGSRAGGLDGATEKRNGHTEHLATILEPERTEGVTAGHPHVPEVLIAHANHPTRRFCEVEDGILCDESSFALEVKSVSFSKPGKESRVANPRLLVELPSRGRVLALPYFHMATRKLPIASGIPEEEVVHRVLGRLATTEHDRTD
jgi:hypothetical protein